MKYCVRFMVILLLSFCSFTKVLANLPYFPIDLPRENLAHFDDARYHAKQLVEWWYFNGKITAVDHEHKLRHFWFFSAMIYGADLSGQPKITPAGNFQLVDLDEKKVVCKSEDIIYLLFPQLATFTSIGDNPDAKLKIGLGNTSTYFGTPYQYLFMQKHHHSFVLKSIGWDNRNGIDLKLYMEPSGKHGTYPLFMNGDSATPGLMPISADTNAYYYSFTKLPVTGGKMLVDGEELEVKSGRVWYDHEWGDIAAGIGGPHYWFGLQLENGIDINLTAGFDLDGKIVFTQANIIKNYDGESTYISPNASRSSDDSFSVSVDENIPSFYFKKLIDVKVVPGEMDRQFPLHFLIHLRSKLFGEMFLDNRADILGQDFFNPFGANIWEGYSTVIAKYRFSKFSRWIKVRGFSATEEQPVANPG